MTKKSGTSGLSGQPKAARIQGTVDARDLMIHWEARIGHPNCIWWWGLQNRSENTGAWCWVCDDWITNFDTRRGPEEDKLKEILHHRDQHLKDLGLDKPNKQEAKRNGK